MSKLLIEFDLVTNSSARLCVMTCRKEAASFAETGTPIGPETP